MKKNLQIGTISIIIINLVLFIMMQYNVVIKDNLLLNTDWNIIQNKPWTIITVFFSNENMIHLSINMVLLYFFGRELEKVTSTKSLFLIYLISGIIGSLTIPFFASYSNWEGSVIGASVATFGVVTAFGVVKPNFRILGGPAKVYPILLFIANASLYFMNPTESIGALGHAAGILVGLISGGILKRHIDHRIKTI